MANEDVGAALARSFGAATKSTPVTTSVTTGATLILAANNRRKSAILYNSHATDTMYVGPSGVTTSNGIPVVAGASLTDNASTDAWYAIAASGSTARVLEVVRDS